MKKNTWISIKDYKPHRSHIVVLNNGKKSWVCYNRKVVLCGMTIIEFYKVYDVKRVMILSRK